MGNRAISALKRHLFCIKALRMVIRSLRYHSILIEEMPEDFEVTARSTDDQAIMGIQHKSLPIYGFQYHPESIGTPDGLSSIRNFIEKVVK